MNTTKDTLYLKIAIAQWKQTHEISILENMRVHGYVQESTQLYMDWRYPTKESEGMDEDEAMERQRDTVHWQDR